MRKLSVLLTLLLVALCANVSYAWDFANGKDINSLAFKYVCDAQYDDGTKAKTTVALTKTTTADGVVWYGPVNLTGGYCKSKIRLNDSDGNEFGDTAIDGDNGKGDALTSWSKQLSLNNAVMTFHTYSVGTYQLQIKGGADYFQIRLVAEGSDNYIKDEEVVETFDFFTGETIQSLNFRDETGREQKEMSVGTSEEGGKLWYLEFTPSQVDIEWKWFIVTTSGKTLWRGRQAEYPVGKEWIEMSPKSDDGRNTLKNLDTNAKYRIEIKANPSDNSKPVGRIFKVVNETTWTIDVTCPSAYDGFTFGNLQVSVNGEWKNVTDRKYTGETAPTAFRYETVTFPSTSPYSDGVYLQNFVWEGQLTAEDATLNGVVADLHEAKFKFNDNAEGTFGQPKEVTVTANGNTLVAKEVTATRVANAWDYTVMTNRTSLDDAQVKFISSNDRHDAVSGALVDAAVFNAPELPSAIPAGLTREDGIFTVFIDLTGMEDHGAPKIWIWSEGGAGNDYFDGKDDYPGMQMTHVSDKIYKWEYRGEKLDPTKVIFTYGTAQNHGKYYGGEGVDVKNGDFFTLDGVQGTVPVAASTPKGWYAMGAFGSEYAEANKMTAYEGAEGIYYIDVTNAQKGAKVWFESPENASMITPEASGALSLGMKWLAATDANESGYFTFAEDCAEGRLFVNTIANQVILADKTFNPLTGNGTEIVFFMGDKHGAVKNVRCRLGKNGSYTTFEGARWTKAPYDGFWFIEIPDVTLYDDIKFSVLVDGEGDGDFYDVTPSLAGDAYDRANWWKFIYGQIEEMKDDNNKDLGATSYQTYITPEEYLEEASKTKTTVYVFGQAFKGNGLEPSWTPQNKSSVIEMNLYNGIGVLEITNMVAASSSDPTKLKLSWMPYFNYIGEEDGAVVEKRAWSSFNLGIVGGYDAADEGDVNSSSRFYLRKPRSYNNYSESDWVLGDATVPAEKCYLVLDSKERTLTLLTFNPQVKLGNQYNIKVEQKAVGHLDESLFTDGKMFKGSEAGGNAYPEFANDLEVTFTVTPAYDGNKNAEAIKEEFSVKYQFYNCSHGFKAGESTSDKNSHDGDELIAEIAGPLDGTTEFAIKNIVTSHVPQLMVQAVYTLKNKGEGTYDATTFHTIPSGLISEDGNLEFQTANPVLDGADYKLGFASLYPQEDGDWGVHFQFPFGATTEKSEMVYYPDYEVSCGMSRQNAAPTHAGMKHLIENPYAWGMIGYEPYESGNYDHAVHNWSNVALKHSALNLSLDGIASNLDDAAQAVKDDGIDVTLHFVYPYVIYKDQIITQIDKSETPARVARAAAAEPEGEYEIHYAYATTNRLYKEADLNGVITGVENVAVGAEKPVDVYTVSGALIMRGTTKAEAVKALAPGIYVIGNEKVVVK